MTFGDWALSAAGVTKAYRKGKLEVPVLHGVDVSVAPGEYLALVGQSGSGKSTLLHLLGVLDRPDAGSISYRGQRIDNLSASARDRLRNETFGFVFQFYHLLPELSALENVMMPLMIRHSVWQWGPRRADCVRRAEQLLERVGLDHRKLHKPSEMSGGELQRAAIARALIAEPRILLADEPTGNLDTATGQSILAILRDLNRDGLTIVMVTHNLELAHETDRVVRVVDGRIEAEPAPLSRETASETLAPVAR